MASVYIYTYRVRRKRTEEGNMPPKGTVFTEACKIVNRIVFFDKELFLIKRRHEAELVAFLADRIQYHT